MNEIRPGTIIVLNGTSSAGKSSIAKAWVAAQPGSWLCCGLDLMQDMLAARYFERPVWGNILGVRGRDEAVAHTLVRGLHASLAAMSREGISAIADHVLFWPEWVGWLARALHDRPAYLVGVRCPLEVAVAREQSRKNRTLGQVAEQYDVVHAHCSYDVEVDTSVLATEQCVAHIQAHVHTHAPRALMQLTEG
jgi:chloramphenicol 3-O phosphotransferase